MARPITLTTSRRRRRASLIPALVTGIALAVQTVIAVEVKVGFEKTFDFGRAQTWGWNPKGSGHVRMARSAEDDPADITKAAEPVIMSAVMTAMEQRGLQFRADTPDLFVTYYLLLTIGTSAQEMGQFLPAVTSWGLPPFAPATQSLEMMNQGSLVLDVGDAQKVVWRGVARSKIKFGETAERREALLREAVRDLLKKFPKKS
jgi:hypothetical protein